MTRIVVLALTFLALSPLAMAEEWTGYIADSECAKHNERKATSDDHTPCAYECLKKGASVVLVTEREVFKIENRDKVEEYIGQKVTLTGKKDGDKIMVDSVKK